MGAACAVALALAGLWAAAPAGAQEEPPPPPPAYSVGDVTVSEDAGTATFTVERSAFALDTSVGYATVDGTALAGADYTGTSGTLEFDPLVTSQDVQVPILPDTLGEPDENFVLRLTDGGGATIDEGTGTITANDQPSISVADSAATGEGGEASFAVSLSNPSSTAVTVDYATAAGTAGTADFTAPAPGTLTFDPGETGPKTVAVAVTDDDLDEDEESFALDLSNPAGATIARGQASAAITDEDPEPVVSVTGDRVTEGDSGTREATFDISLDAASGRTVTVDVATEDGTATAPDDYESVQETVTFAPGDPLTKQVTVDVKGDTLDEPDHSFRLVLDSPVNGRFAAAGEDFATATIADDDDPPPVLRPDPGPAPTAPIVPDPQPNDQGPGTFKLSDEWRSSTWAYVNRRVLARRKPHHRAKGLRLLRTVTGDYTPELVLALQLRRHADGSEWVRVRLPMRPNNTTGWVPREALGAFRRTNLAFRINRRSFRATLYRDGRRVWRARIGVGQRQWPTPRGNFYIRERLVPRNKGGIYGVFAFGLSAYSPVLTDWPGGGIVGVHGTNQPGLIPGRISHGCVRVRNRAISRLRRLMPLGTPVRIR